jgi:hypothetical protein
VRERRQPREDPRPLSGEDGASQGVATLANAGLRRALRNAQTLSVSICRTGVLLVGADVERPAATRQASQ